MQKVKIAFVDFWDNFDKEGFVCTRVLAKHFDVEIMADANEADYVFYSVNGDSHWFLPPEKIKIFYTGEAVTPDFNACDYAIGFDWLTFGDIVSPSLLIGQAIGRMANLLNGDAFGTPTGGNFGLLYPEGTLAFKTYGAQPLWPAEVWEGQLDVVIFVLLLLFRTTNHARGQALCMYGMLYSVVRFFLEMLRGDYAEPWLFGLKSAQATSLGIFLILLALFLYCGWRDKKQAQAATEAATKKRKNK